jgi:hypothetical protein
MVSGRCFIETRAHTEERDQGFLLPPAEGSSGPSTQCFPYKMNRTELSGERTLGYTVDELLVTD